MTTILTADDRILLTRADSVGELICSEYRNPFDVIRELAATVTCRPGEDDATVNGLRRQIADIDALIPFLAELRARSAAMLAGIEAGDLP